MIKKIKTSSYVQGVSITSQQGKTSLGKYWKLRKLLILLFVHQTVYNYLLSLVDI